MTISSRFSPRWLFGAVLRAGAAALAVSTITGFTGCGNVIVQSVTVRPKKAQQWYEKALEQYGQADMDAANESSQQALDLVPEDEEIKMLAARVALARLELDRTLQLLTGLEGLQAASLKGRAHWYKGDLENAAHELEKVVGDPESDDSWAKEIIKLAVEGAGARQPFDIVTSDGRLEVVQMARVAGAPLYVVPVEIDGDSALALISTGSAEVMLDSTARREPSWVSLRFGKRLEVKDVPTLPQDLSEMSRRLGAPIKALIGSNLLRHLHVTLDHRGRQFVARSFEAPPPPVASRVDVFYLRGGGMVLGGAMGEGSEQRVSLFVDTGMSHSLALDKDGWKKAGLDAATLPLLDGAGGEKLRTGDIPLLKLGSFSLPTTKAVFGPRIPIAKVEKELGIDIDGTLGAGVLADFRVTFSDRGRVLWVEQRAGVPDFDGVGPTPQLPQPGDPPLDPGLNPDLEVPGVPTTPGAMPLPGDEEPEDE
jgi:hypothetical protein